MAETLTVVGEDDYDEYGELIPAKTERTISGCVVGLQGQAELNGPGVWDGDATTLEVLAPGGTTIFEGEIVNFRGELYEVVHVPFDWSPGRRPANPRHKPRTKFLIKRKVA